jgi:hypothetical protein
MVILVSHVLRVNCFLKTVVVEKSTNILAVDPTQKVED